MAATGDHRPPRRAPAAPRTDTLAVTGASAFGTGQATIDASGNFATSGTGSFGGLLTANGGLTVNGVTTLNGNTNVTGDLGASGTTTTGALMVTNNASVGGNLDVTGTGSFGGALTTHGITNTGTVATDNLTSTTATIGTLNTTTINNTGAITSGSVTTGTLDVTGATTTHGITNTGALNQTGVATFTTTDPAQGSSTVTGGLISLTSPAATHPGAPGTGGITLDATVDPVLTVTNGTAAGTTTINNGAVTAGTSVSTPLLGATVANIGTANVGTTNTTNLNVAPGGSVNMGDNVVHGVGDPIVGTDAANKGYVDRGLNKAYEGTAIALALSQPIFAPGQSWAIRAGYGGFESANAGGVSVAGIIGRDWFGAGTTIAIDGGVGFADNVVAGKAGVTIGFGGGYVPMK